MIALIWVATLFARFDSHQLQRIAPAGKRIEIEDHSIWYIAPHSRSRIQDWKKGDTLQIYPNLDSFSNSSFPYYIKNKRKPLTPVASNLQLGPEKASTNAIWINQVHVANQQITLQNGQDKITHWQVEPKDKEFLKTWKPTQGIVIGNNKGLLSWWYSSCEYILINVNRGEWIRVQPLQN
ncbi:MAG: hypothetical protein KDK44_04860 [Chlamydiia bacterium]|nr:hypothetical protein [Chlamydiia bacterium]